MSKALKVFGIVADGKFRRIVACTSQTEAARLLGYSVNTCRNYGSWTGNKVEVETAMSTPGRVWRMPASNFHGEFTQESKDTP